MWPGREVHDMGADANGDSSVIVTITNMERETLSLS